MKKKQEPIKPVYYWQLSDWKYIPACSTNVMERFKQYGWTPPSERKESAV
jgi:hypothetical protein